MIISYSTFFPIDSPHAVAVDDSIAIKPYPVRESVIELDVVARKANVTKDFNIVVNVFFISVWICFFYL